MTDYPVTIHEDILVKGIIQIMYIQEKYISTEIISVQG